MTGLPLISPSHSIAGTTDRHRQPGFSLLELLVALAVAGILLLVALPGYRYAVIKSNRAAARATLLDVMSRQEQYFVNHKRHALTLDALGLPDPYHIDGQGDAVATGSAAYRITLELPDGAYQGVTALPLNRQAGDTTCLALSLSRLGAREVSGTSSANPAGCW